MRQNPIQCRPGGTLVINSEHRLTATSAGGLCSSTFQYPLLNNLSQSNAMLNFMCPAKGSSSIGKGTIVLSDTYGYAKWLGSAINDAGVPLDPSPGYTYTVTCSVDTSNVFSYHNVTLGFQGLGNSSQSSYARFLSGSSKTCIPRYPTISNILFATAAGANWQLLNENQGLDGWFDSLSGIAGLWRQSTWAFNNSANGLEDALGLISALVVSRVNTSGSLVSATSQIEGDASVLGGASALIKATRLGNGSLAALLLIIPPVICTGILAYLMIMGCGFCSSKSINKFPNATTPHYSKSIRELVELGRMLSSPRSLSEPLMTKNTLSTIEYKPVGVS